MATVVTTPLVLALRLARRGRDNRTVDTAILLANSIGRPLVCYVEAEGTPAWLEELEDVLRARAVGLVVGTPATRADALARLDARAVLVEVGVDLLPLGVAGVVEVPVYTRAFELVLAEDPTGAPLWERALRAAEALRPRGIAAPAPWKPYPVGAAVPRAPRASILSSTESPDAAEARLRRFCADELIGFALRSDHALDDLAGALASGTLAAERIVHSVTEHPAPRPDQELALARLWPAALRPAS